MSPVARSAETIKVALIGCGSRGTGAASQALRTRGPIQLWAMADLFADRIDASLAGLNRGEEAAYDREAHGGLASQIEVPPERRFTGFDAYRRAIDSGVDLVILASPPHFRPDHFAYAVEKAKHVFMEKPLAVDAPGIRQILAAGQQAEKQNLKVGVGLMYRHHRGYQETVARLQDGAIGPIPLLRAYWNTGFLRDTAARPAAMTEMEYQLRNPYHFLWLSGDYFVDALLHFIDVCLWVKGTHPIKAQGQGGRQANAPLQFGDTYDHHMVEYTFADGSALVAATRQISGCWNSASAHAHGLAGYSEINRARIEGANPWRFRGPLANPYQREHDVLIEAIRENRPHNDVPAAAASTMTAILGRMASYSGQMVTWEQGLDSSVRLAPSQYSFDAPPPVIADATGRYPTALPGLTRAF